MCSNMIVVFVRINEGILMKMRVNQLFLAPHLGMRKQRPSVILLAPQFGMRDRIPSVIINASSCSEELEAISYS